MAPDRTPEQAEKERLLRREKREARAAAALKRHRKERRLVIAAGAFSFVATLVGVHFTGILEPPKAPTPPAAMVSTTPEPAVRTAVATDPDRPNFRYSIVPGGVRSKEEVMQAILRDPVVADHYAGVVPALLRSERLTEPMSAHVSYRIGDKVYFTRKKLTLNAGEKVLTDGTTTMRERCGNILSMDPLAPAIEGAEPAAPEFDLHVDPYVPTMGIELADPPMPDSLLVPPSSGTPACPECAPVVLSNPPTVVPEPSTWVLLATGLGFGAVKLLRRKNRT